MRVLIVEDEPLLANAIRRGLRNAAIAADIAGDGAAALEFLDRIDVDVVLLDRDLPVISGDDVCRRLIETGNRARILMLTAARRLDDRVGGFELGADDYLSKPFEFPELVARVRALARRAEPVRPPRWEALGVTIDVGRREVYRAGRYVRLSPKEFAVLRELMQIPGDVLSAEDLLARAWDEQADPFTSTIKVTISSLRRKLGDPPVIQTRSGFGYVFQAPDTDLP
ncbi:response regulator transcription factor [Microbacterium sp. NPDC087589]|uniref:response regulator transcription factor n=1 Tax=Microbacterium sp. NPDC087589 TaxID=3364191 RepID=UPI0038088B22